MLGAGAIGWLRAALGVSLTPWMERHADRLASLERAFSRVLAFEIRDTEAVTAAGSMVCIPDVPEFMSTLRAASMVVHEGSKMGEALSGLVGEPAPRSFAVLPVVEGDELSGLIYVDQGPLPFDRDSIMTLAGRASESPRDTGRRPRRPPRPRRAFRIAHPADSGGETLPPIGTPAVEEDVIRLVPRPPSSLARVPRRLKAPVSPRVIAAASVGALALLVGSVVFGPASKSRGERLVEVPQSATVGQIADLLQDRHLIRSTRAFRILTQLTGTDRRVRAGTYRLPTGAWLWTIVSRLAGTPDDSRLLVVHPGDSLQEIAARAGALGVATDHAFLEAARDLEVLRSFHIPGPSAEGYILPGTYEVARDRSEQELLVKMLGRFQVSALPLFPGGSSEAIMRWVTLASVVQRETSREDEMGRIAGVFINRVDRGMRLQSTATVRYAINDNRPLQPTDLAIDHAYNTYRRFGLPPGPIGSPSEAALRAASAPEAHNFLFFVTDATGRHVFTENFDDHRAAWASIKERQRTSAL